MTTVNHTNKTPNSRFPSTLLLTHAGATLTNIASASTDYSASVRTVVDLTPFNFIKLVVNVTTGVAASGSLNVFKGSTPAAFTNAVSSGALTSTALVDSGWIALADADKIPQAVLSLETHGGDGAADPVVGQISVYGAI